jgi:hypothetical protein
VKFTEAGTITVSVAARPDGVRLSVADTGRGVPPEFAARLFEKFSQADSSTTRRFGGTGLGLAISRELCEAMGGTIRVESPAGGGATFIVDLALRRSRTAPTAAAPAAVEASRPQGPPLRILAAEDNPVNQLVLRTLLEQLGVEATLVADGLEAIRAWEQADFDLILMDVQMPQMDGPEATTSDPRGRGRRRSGPHADRGPDRQRHAPSDRDLRSSGDGRLRPQADRDRRALRRHRPGHRRRAAAAAQAADPRAA